MARKRMIDPSFWTDEKLGDEQPIIRLLFMGLISQSDDAGRLNGHPALLKSLIFPYDQDITPSNVEQWLSNLHRKNLIQRYEVDTQKYILITNFNKHQTINRPQPSKLPEATNEVIMNDHGAFTESSVNDHAQKKLIEVNISEFKGREEEDKETSKPSSTPSENPFRLFESEGFGTLSALIGQKLGDFIDTYGERWTCEAMKEAAYHSKRSLPYVKSILDRYKTSGVDEPWLVERIKTFPNGGGNSGKYGQHYGRTEAENRAAADKDSDLFIGHYAGM